MKMFVAIEFEPEVKKYLKEVQQKLVPFSKRGTYTEEENMYLTVKFIGDVTQDDISGLAEGLQEAASRFRSFKINLSHLGFFPMGNRTTVWAGIEKSDSFLKLFNNIERSLVKQGFAKEKKGMNAHISLAREVDLVERFDTIKDKIPLESMEISVTKVSLMESKRISGKVINKAVFVQNLK